MSNIFLQFAELSSNVTTTTELKRRSQERIEGIWTWLTGMQWGIFLFLFLAFTRPLDAALKEKMHENSTLCTRAYALFCTLILRHCDLPQFSSMYESDRAGRTWWESFRDTSGNFVPCSDGAKLKWNFRTFNVRATRPHVKTNLCGCIVVWLT